MDYIELTKATRKVLRAMNDNPPDLQGRFYTVDGLVKLCGLERERVDPILRNLCREDYVEFADAQKTSIRLLEYGYAYKELNCKRIRKLWGERIWAFLAGIGVALATAHVVDFVSYIISLFGGS